MRRLKRRLIRVFAFLLALLATLVGFSITPIVIAAYDSIGWLAYPLYFGSYMILNGLVFTVLLPYQVKRDAALPFLQRWLRVDSGRFEKGIWSWLKRKGAFVTTLGAALILGPFFAAVYIRFLGLAEKKAWFYSFVTTLIATLFWVAFYTGLFSLIKSWVT